jgi:hypothetical protein
VEIANTECAAPGGEYILWWGGFPWSDVQVARHGGDGKKNKAGKQRRKEGRTCAEGEQLSVEKGLRITLPPLMLLAAQVLGLMGHHGFRPVDNTCFGPICDRIVSRSISLLSAGRSSSSSFAANFLLVGTLS